MGTNWRGLLAPIDQPTGDGRRMALGAMRWRELPLALKWQRVDEVGHYDSVIIGSLDTLNIGTVQQAIDNGWISAEAVGQTMQPTDLGLWGGGELFDDADSSAMPRLAEDVAEALLLTGKKVIGPSVDAGAATAVLVRTGTDVPLTGEEVNTLLMQSFDTGEPPPIEELFTDYQVAAATLVGIPAFEQARPFELGTAVVQAGAAPTAVTAVARMAALTANDSSARLGLPGDVFDAPPIGAPYKTLTVEDRGEGFLRVFGYVAPFGVCHAEFRNACYTAPPSQSDYALFHRYVQEIDDGDLIGVGRLTCGFGRVGTGCKCCPGKHDHACNGFGLSRTIGHYDSLTTLANVRATETELGIWFAGWAPANLGPEARAALAGGRVSGDWRESGSELELVEVLVLHRRRPRRVPTAHRVDAWRAPVLADRGGRLDRPGPARAAGRAAHRLCPAGPGGRGGAAPPEADHRPGRGPGLHRDRHHRGGRRDRAAGRR